MTCCSEVVAVDCATRPDGRGGTVAIRVPYCRIKKTHRERREAIVEDLFVGNGRSVFTQSIAVQLTDF